MQIWMDVDTALSEVPVNVLPLIDDTDFKSIETAIVYNSAGLTLYWHFVTPAGAYTVTQVTPTTGGDYDWSGDGTDPSGMYTIEIPASGGASINNDTEGFGWFTGVATGVLPWRGPIIGFRAAGLNDALIESAYSATRGLAGTALPAAAADAAGGLPISDAGGLDLDSMGVDVDHLTKMTIFNNIVSTAMWTNLGVAVSENIGNWTIRFYSYDRAGNTTDLGDYTQAGGFVKDGGWVAALGEEAFYIYVIAGAGAFPACDMTLTITSGFGMESTLVVPLPAHSAGVSGDFFVRGDGTLQYWYSGQVAHQGFILDPIAKEATLGTPAGADLATDIAAVKSDTAEIAEFKNVMMNADWTKQAITPTSFYLVVDGIGYFTIDKVAGTRTWTDSVGGP